MQVTIVGSVGADPTLRFTASGRAMATFSVAENNKYKDKAGEWQEKPTTWWNIIVWAEMAESVAESLSKGDRVVVVGRTETETWEQDGQKRSSLKVHADEVAPSLRWATAKVQRNERQSGRNDDGGYVPPSEPPRGYDADPEPF